MDGRGLLRFLQLVLALFVSLAASSFLVGDGLDRALGGGLNWLVVFELAAGVLWLSSSLGVVLEVAGRLFAWFRAGGVVGVLGGLTAVDGRVVGGRLLLWRFSLAVGVVVGVFLVSEAVFCGLWSSLAGVVLVYRVSLSLVVLAAALWCLLFAEAWRR